MPLEFMYRFARHARLVDGADEVHREVVARRILKAYSAPEDGVPTEYIPRRREESVRRFAAMLEAATAND
jgi:acyl-CoA dehydrogenase